VGAILNIRVIRVGGVVARDRDRGRGSDNRGIASLLGLLGHYGRSCGFYEEEETKGTCQVEAMQVGEGERKKENKEKFSMVSQNS
jgi:hypothetical protein